jgi:hypothetical protein
MLINNRHKDPKSKNLSRRNFLGSTAAAAAFSVVPLNFAFKNAPRMAPGKPDSNFGGVQIGAITYSWCSMPGRFLHNITIGK